MDREILFRGKRVDNGEWIEGNLLKFCWKTDILTYIATIDFNPFDAERTTFFVVPETVGQYTGLCDKNGTKIFEGDIIEYDEQDGIARYSVIWSEKSACFAVAGYKGMIIGDFAFYTSERCKKIGNIHDNPEILEKKRR